MKIKNFSLTSQLTKRPILLAAAIFGLFLFILAVFLSSRVSRLSKDNLKDLTTLNEVSPGFNNQTLEQLKQEINKLEVRLLALAYLFDPVDKSIKKDYDPAIYFVDELSKIGQLLKLKATNKQINYTDLGFKEKLPEEKEAQYLLRQLYALRDVVSRGMDCGINFISITPLPVEDLNASAGMKVAKVRVELSAPASSLIEFIIQLGEVVPLVSLESILLKSQDSSLNLEMTFSHIIVEADWKDKGTPFNPLNIKDVFLEREKFINIVRGNNPFSVPKLQESVESPLQASGEQPKHLPRFLYRGKAILKSKEVAVIEDTLNKETVFLAPQEKIGDFILTDLRDLQIILKNITNDEELIIKREER